MAMTLRLSTELEEELRAVAEEDRRSVHQTVVLAIELFLAARETAQVKADPEALRALAEAQQAVRDGDVVYGTDAVSAMVSGRRAS
jgi:predicted transcriptional regulator